MDTNAPPISPLALAAVERIDRLFDIERTINGLGIDERLAVRQAQSAPLVAELEAGCTRRANVCPSMPKSPGP